MTRIAWAIARWASVSLVAFAGVARAETPIDHPTAVDIDRDSSPPGRPELGFDGGAPLDGGWAATVQLGWLDRPVSFGFASSSGQTNHPIEHRQTLFLGGALALGEGGLVEARLPMMRQTGEVFQFPGVDRKLDRWVVGDLHLAGRARVVGRPSFSVFARGDVGIPTGDDDNFAGDSSWNLAWSLIGRFVLPAGVAVSAAGGIRLRGDEVLVGDRIVSNELFGAAGISVPIPPIHPLWCVREQVKLSAEIVGVFGDRVAGATGPSPVEARLGLVTHPRDNITLGFRVGAGLDDEIGAPRFRALVELTLWGTAQVSSLLPTDDSAETDTESDRESDTDDSDPDESGTAPNH